MEYKWDYVHIFFPLLFLFIIIDGSYSVVLQTLFRKTTTEDFGAVNEKEFRPTSTKLISIQP